MIELVDNMGRGPLYWACYFGHVSCFDHAMSKLSTLQSINAKNQGCFFNSAIHAAAAKNRQNMIRQLIARKVDITGSDRNNWTPLHTARAYGYDETQKMLENELLRQSSKISKTSARKSVLQRPRRWNKLDMRRALRVSEDGLVIFLEDSAAEDKFSRDYVRTAIADFCIPDNERVFYFEVKITCPENSTIDLEISIRLSEEHVPLDEMVGSQLGSWGFHWDNDQLYDEGYVSQHTVGCGIDFSKNVRFFTKNGQYLS
ncbi:hypothetical protein ACQKWADRAFT_299309 [Trichoderma austrokoningii]